MSYLYVGLHFKVNVLIFCNNINYSQLNGVFTTHIINQLYKLHVTNDLSILFFD